MSPSPSFTADFTADQRDRIAGVLTGAACGDALGVPYEFAALLGPDETPEMIGGGLGPYEPGEWSDDTQMALCIAQVAATGADLREQAALDGIARWFLKWFAEGASDVGMQTRRVLAATARREGAGAGAAMRAAATELHAETGRSAGNGSLMRTAVVAVAHLDDVVAMAEAARAVSELTHFDPLAGDACVLWCAGIRRAVLDGVFDGVREGLDLLPVERRAQWADWLADAETRPPGTFIPNGFVVQALQAAWSAVVHTPADGSRHLERALHAVVRVGDDTDTIAAIAGALLGARWGVSAIPAEWRAAVNGWPGMRAADLEALSLSAAGAA
ncbi:ADP-ribosylglycohydrolase family protein [Actinomadura alba]|uniref:ADP-ribosylglycohydrolase family protein n=1 Tax=Actinomadura alba TaxID=406431 RepID=A0ABR7LX80_9ACTN|nr:ADP-ribosylglycohydrolase family protein [Actinomadura alba]MBC6469463.1 ADP-ribosylglycohydrolase family protein [Actinomadura alba]